MASSTIEQVDDLCSGSHAEASRVSLVNKSLTEAGIPVQLWSLTSLTRLSLAGNVLASIPIDLSQLTALTSLCLSQNRIAEVPEVISQLQALEDLDLSRNSLHCLPSSIGSLPALKYLNLMNNSLAAVPPQVGRLSALYRLGLKGNQLKSLPESVAQLKGLVELFITNNCLVTLPDGMSGLTSLVKLQASFNALTSLPAGMGHLPRLELMRVAVNAIQQVPAEFSGLNSLAWFSLAGNPACPAAPPIRSDILPLALDQLDLDTALGDGASGDVFAAKFQGQDVAVKIFKAEASPDGHAQDEIAVTCFVNHPNLIKVIGIIEHPHALVLERVWGAPLALKPNFESLLRCRWAAGQTFTTQFVLNVATCVAAALAYLHSHNICHGDVYAHNVLADDHGGSVLCDYGASYFYQPGGVSYEAQEVRAFGLLLKDLVSRIKLEVVDDQPDQDSYDVLQHVLSLCTESNTLARQRPTFSQLYAKLKQ